MLSAACCDKIVYGPSAQHCNGLLSKYSQTCVQRPPLGPEKSGPLKEVPDETEI